MRPTEFYLLLRTMQTNIPNENYLRSYLYNANVLLVGGAEISREKMEELEAANYDIWVRVNDHYKTQGGRAEVIYVSGTQEADTSLEHSVIVECKPEGLASDWQQVGSDNGNKYIWFDVNTYRAPNPFGGEHEWLNNFYRDLGTMPFTGMIALKHLLNLPIKSISLVGFSFYERLGIIPHSRNSHFIYPQAEWLYNISHKDYRISLEPEFYTILEKLEAARQHRERKLIGAEL
jgi:hypothetical protein